jgi:hypothetical protein
VGFFGYNPLVFADDREQILTDALARAKHLREEVHRQQGPSGDLEQAALDLIAALEKALSSGRQRPD